MALKKLLLRSALPLSLLACLQLPAQTLFTYGRHAVSKDEFLQSYRKNLTPGGSAKMSYEAYLDLYSKFRIKVQAALDARMDTLPAQRAELAAFRDQLADNFLKEDAGIKLLIDEAARRSLKDIHLSYIFIPLPSDAPPEAVETARRQIDTAYTRLKNGEAFNQVASIYTPFPDLGYITAFVLPYELENLAYNTAPGSFSTPFRTASGFYIFRNNGERKAVGQIRIAQILLAFPPDATEEQRRGLATRADSLYGALRQGADFAALADRFSNDNLTFHAGGEMPAFGVGYYDPLFEKAAFDLARDGDLSKPFRTDFGYHIIKRIQRIPVIEDPLQPDWQAVIRERVLQSDRMQVARNLLLKNIRELIARDALPQVLGNDSAAISYYHTHLEQYNSEFAAQLDEFKQGNLLFGIMQENVWDPAAEDSAGQHSYYNEHADKYYWENSADALLFTVSNETEATAIRAGLHDARPWRSLAERYAGVLLADSGRFELTQLPVTENTSFKEGLTTAPVVNHLSSRDSSISFTHIIRLYPRRQKKSLEEARGSVISDYQDHLEKTWVENLMKKYPVRVNKKVFRKLPPA